MENKLFIIILSLSLIVLGIITYYLLPLKNDIDCIVDWSECVNGSRQATITTEQSGKGKKCEVMPSCDKTIAVAPRIKCVDNICGNNGRCEDTFNFRENYKCICNPGFTGDKCGLDCRRNGRGGGGGRGGEGSDGGRGGRGSGGRGGRGGGRGSGRARGPICGTWTEQTMFDISQLAEEKNSLVARDVFDKHAVKFGDFTAEQITNAIIFVKDNKVAEKCRECGIPVISNSGNEGCSVISGTPELTPCLGATPHYSLIAKAKTMSHSSSYIATVMLENVSFNGIDAIWRSL